MTSADELVLAGDFPAASREQWRELVLGVLRRSGVVPADGEPDVDEVLGTETYDGVRLRPLYTADDAPSPDGGGLPGFGPYVRGGRPVVRSWDVRQRHSNPDPEVTAREVMADLENGVTSLWLAVDATTLPRVLDGVYLDLVGVVLDGGPEFPALAEAYLKLLDERGIAADQAAGNLGADPLTVAARTGTEPELGPAVELARRCAAERPNLRAIVADGLPYHEAGGSDAQELGCALAAGTTYLRALTEAGMSVDEACRRLEFRYAATADQFATIAKLRAARRLWHRVTEVSGSANPQRQHAVTSPAMQTRRDPWVNLLRGTVACFAAGTGGADAVTVLPFDSAVGLPDAFARRIARNTHALLVEESQVARVTDPAGGSWFVESLTDELARQAWAVFQRIEAAGGLPAALADGSLAADLDRTWQRRRANIAHRHDPITGVSEYPNLAETPLERAGDDWLKGAFSRTNRLKAPFSQIPRVRYAEDFERLRDRGDAILARTGNRPAVFLATLGPLAEHSARAGFAANLFQAGGFATVTAGPTDDTDTLVDAYRAAGAPPVACLCGTDTAYDDRAAATTEALRTAGAAEVLIAIGDTDTYRRSESPETSTRIRVADAMPVYPGCDAVAVLEGLYRPYEEVAR